MRLKTKLLAAGKTATGLEIPASVVEALGSGKRPKVVVTIGKHTWRSTIAVYGGKYLLGVSAENREKAGVKAGDMLNVNLELDTEERTVEVPADFKRALAKEPKAKAAFEKLSYSHRKEHVRAIEEAKAAETRARRIAKALEMLRAKA
jgi:hypothetical protein